MKRLFLKSLLSLTILGASGALQASQPMSPDETRAQVKEALSYLKKHGREAAFAEFSKPGGSFTKGEFYIVATRLDGVVLAHGANPRLIGKNIRDIKDSDGKYFVQEQITLANEKGSGWVQFRWPNPVSQVIEQKMVYIERYEDLLLAGGTYKK